MFFPYTTVFILLIVGIVTAYGALIRYCGFSGWELTALHVAMGLICFTIFMFGDYKRIKKSMKINKELVALNRTPKFDWFIILTLLAFIIFGSFGIVYFIDTKPRK